MSSGFRRRPYMSRNQANNGSIASFQTRSTAGCVEHEGAESLYTVDPRFMTIDKDAAHTPSENSVANVVKIETWLDPNEKRQIDLKETPIRAIGQQKQMPATKLSKGPQTTRKPFFQNLKQLHTVQSNSRIFKTRSISTSRATISNHEVSSTNEETPRNRKKSLREKLNKLNTKIHTSKWQTIDLHHDECSGNESCCLKRNCESQSKEEHNVNFMNLCPANEKLIVIKPKKIISGDPIFTEEETEVSRDIEKRRKKLNDNHGHHGDQINRSRLIEEKMNLIRMKNDIENFYRDRRPSDIKPICKLIVPFIIITILSLSIISFYCGIGVFTRIYSILESWIGSSALVMMQRRAQPPTKWELWSNFVRKCVEKMANTIGGGARKFKR